MNILFVIVYQKAKLELQTIIVKICYNKEESLTRIVVICALTNIVILISLIQSEKKNKKVFIGEISSIIFSIVSHYLDLFKAKIS